MGFGVFIHRADSIYDDSPAERYQFPVQYLGRAQQCVGDWIVYYEPRKVVASRGYFAIAKVEKIIPDPTSADMYLALIEPGTYLDFAHYVPFSDSHGLIERGLLNGEGRISGRAQAAVRPLNPEDFRRIVELGLADDAPVLPRSEDEPGFSEPPTPLLYERPNQRIEVVTSRLARDRIFRRVVLQAYAQRCAITGLRLINGGGRAEVQAAHIKPVENLGPDIVSNGIALSGTAHWLFDRGLITLSDDLRVEISRHVNDVDGVKSIINKTGYALPPLRETDRPHPHFLKWHRENRFKT